MCQRAQVKRIVPEKFTPVLSARGREWMMPCHPEILSEAIILSENYPVAKGPMEETPGACPVLPQPAQTMEGKVRRGMGGTEGQGLLVPAKIELQVKSRRWGYISNRTKD